MLNFPWEIIFKVWVWKGITPKSVLTCWHSLMTALAKHSEKVVYPDFVMLRCQSTWSQFVMLKVQNVCPPNQCWCVANHHWQELTPSKKQKYILILWCCVGNLLWHHFQCSRFKGYDPQINVDVLTFLNDSSCHPVREISISCFCDAALTICEYSIFHAQGTKGTTPKSVLTCWHS